LQVDKAPSFRVVPSLLRGFDNGVRQFGGSHDLVESGDRDAVVQLSERALVSDITGERLIVRRPRGPARAFNDGEFRDGGSGNVSPGGVDGCSQNGCDAKSNEREDDEQAHTSLHVSDIQ